jgi:hypothetical protein
MGGGDKAALGLWREALLDCAYVAENISSLLCDKESLLVISIVKEIFGYSSQNMALSASPWL